MLREVDRLHSGNDDNGNGTTTMVLENDRLTTLKADVEAWLIKVDALLALYTKVEEDTVVDDNSYTGQVNWLSDIRTTEVKWLGVKINISDWKKYSKALSSARVSSYFSINL